MAMTFDPTDGKPWHWIRALSYDSEGHPDSTQRCAPEDATHMRLCPTPDCWWGIVAIKGRGGTIAGGGQWDLSGTIEKPTLSPSVKISGGKGENARVLWHGYLIGGVYSDA